MKNLLSVKGLKTYFYSIRGIAKAVNGVSFNVNEGEIFGIVGESGSGKTVTCLSIMRLIHEPQGKIMEGEIYFKEFDLLKIDEHKLREMRGKEISMIFQEPMSSLNPVFPIGEQLSEVLQIHQKIDKKRAKEKALHFLNIVGLSEVHRIYNNYPHQLSGGMLQRIMIAIAISSNPPLLIADEPTANLDVTIQAQIIDLIKSLKDEIKMAVIFITHDLGIISEISNRIVIMYAGKIQEDCLTSEIFENPLHPYTKGLINSIPQIDIKYNRITAIPGAVPDSFHLPSGCAFHPRCYMFKEICKSKEPELEEKDTNHFVRCWMV